MSLLTPLDDYIVRHTNKYRKYQCSCGQVKLIRETEVRSGRVKSCGCLHRQLASQRWKDRYASGWHRIYSSRKPVRVPEKGYCIVEMREYNKQDKRWLDWQQYKELSFEDYLQLIPENNREYRLAQIT